MASLFSSTSSLSLLPRVSTRGDRRRPVLQVGVRPGGTSRGGCLAAAVGGTTVDASTAGDPRNSPAATVLREILSAPGLELLPCAHDALSAKVIERAGFNAAFMSGFCVSAARLGRGSGGSFINQSITYKLQCVLTTTVLTKTMRASRRTI